MNPSYPLTLFIVKQCYDYDGHIQISSGLRTSAQFVVDMLLAQGYRAKLVLAVDGNSIDALVAQNKPANVVIEALWVTPTKLAELHKLHPKVRWTVRIHSETPFLAQEGCAVAWLAAYFKQGIQVAFNSKNTMEDFQVIARTIYLPNYYPLRTPRNAGPIGTRLDVGCFGAIRPLKNQLIQACAAVRFAQLRDKQLIFHMNGTRVEQFGSNNLKNIAALLAAAGQTLELHPWMDHNDFLELLATMDICLQISLTESFNIVSADAVSMGVPLVGSAAIPWLPRRSIAKVDSSESIVTAMRLAGPVTVAANHDALDAYTSEAVTLWTDWIGS